MFLAMQYSFLDKKEVEVEIYIAQEKLAFCHYGCQNSFCIERGPISLLFIGSEISLGKKWVRASI